MSASRTSSNLLLWAGLWVAPLAWAVNMQLGQILPYDDCRAELHTSAVTSLVGVVIAALSGVVSWRSAKHPPAGSVRSEAISFAGTVSSLSAFVFTFALIMQGIASMVLSGCER